MSEKIERIGPFEVHPLAAALPLVEGQEFDELVRDIKGNGLHEPIVISHDGDTLIDGRNRYRACLEAGVDHRFRRLEAFWTPLQILDLIRSKNVRRRNQVTAGQLAFFGLVYEQEYAAATRIGRPPESRPVEGETGSDPTQFLDKALTFPDGASTSGRASAKAAEASGASATSIKLAKALEKYAPDLAEQVRAGSMSLEAAGRELKRRRKTKLKEEIAEKPTKTMLTLLTHKGEPIEYPEPASKPTFNQTQGEGISWAVWSWNPVTGCLHGCDYCYAREIADNPIYSAVFPAGFTPLFHRERLDAPRHTVIPKAHRDDPAWRRVFVCSMADLYGRWVPDEWIDRVHAAMLASPEWEYLTLTKFPGRYVGLTMPPRAWVGTSVDEQKRVRLAEDAFRQIDGVAVKWLSLEPLREPLEFTDLSMFDWVVIGAQTQTRQPSGAVAGFAPPFAWVARLVAQAREAGCRVHLKPNLMGRTDGSNPGMTLPDEYPDVAPSTTDSHGNSSPVR